MSETRDNRSSPRSSTGEADSFKGTPDTRLTAFSPDDGSVKSMKMLKGLSRSATGTPTAKRSTSSFHGAIRPFDRDPFVTSVQEFGTRLSPTASTFNPFNGDDTNLRYPSGDRPIAAALSIDLGLSRNLIISSSSTSVSIYDVESWLAELEAKGDQLHGARHLKALNGYVFIHFLDIRDVFTIQGSIRQANQEWKATFANMAHAPPTLSIRSFSSSGVEEVDHLSDQLEASLSEMNVKNSGQILVFALVPPGTVIDSVRATEIVCRILQFHGCIFAFVRQSAYPNGSFRAVVEFCDAGVALSALQHCNGTFSGEGIQIFTTLYQSEELSASGLTEAMQQASLNHAIGAINQGHNVPKSTSSPEPADLRFHTPFTLYPFMIQSPITPSVPYFQPNSQRNPVVPLAACPPNYSVFGSAYRTPPSPALTTHNIYSPSPLFSGAGRIDERRQNATRVTRSTYHNTTSHHNHVDINRIRDGIDVRTTIMLRNIPNKVDQIMLKRIVDESSWGKYDFMYLRIDFANDCNVGYAFINFVDPLDIIDFVNVRGNQRWNCFKSDKVAEISYATIQGKDCLVQKFRNSSVMLEAPHYRPKLYFTSNGPMPELAGQEEPFPEPDNQSKMKRSCENAEHVGLFTPNAGQHFRDEQRRRRSQYDRGTRLAALEEYDYEAAIHNIYGSAT